MEKKEAMKILKDFHDKSALFSVRTALDTIIPELKENEDDRMRKELIRAFKSLNTIKVWNGIERTDILAWLEKQGEKPQGKTAIEAIEEEKVDNQNCAKPIGKVEPKFHEGDWIAHNIAVFVFKVINVGSNGYEIVNRENYKKTMSFDDENNYHLWTIEDAKDGDVLVHYGCTFIFMGIKDGIVQAIEDNMLELVPFGEPTDKNNEYHPATKEQCDLLFQKIKEAGYEWDAEKKELKKIPNAFEKCEIVHIEHGKYYYCIKDYYAGGNKRASKGDVVQALNGMSMMALGVKANEYFIPVNTIKQMSAWSEEDEKMFISLHNLIFVVRDHDCDSMRKKELSYWLESLKNRVQPKQEWGEEDESILQGIWDEILANKHDAKECEWKTYDKFLNWLESLRPQNTWKPTEEQLKSLQEVIDEGHFTSYPNAIETLYEQLKQL